MAFGERPAARQCGRMTRRRLPIVIQTFREMREIGCYYVDKTLFIERLLDGAKHYFLSRPRRFGKSLLVDTLEDALRVRHDAGDRHLDGGCANGGDFLELDASTGFRW